MATIQVPDIGVMTMMRKPRSGKDDALIEVLMDLTREYGGIFQLPGFGPRNPLVSSFALVDELCDDQRFDKALGTGQLEVRGLVGDGLFTAWTSEPNWCTAHNILLPTFSRQAMKGYVPCPCPVARDDAGRQVPHHAGGSHHDRDHHAAPG